MELKVTDKDALIVVDVQNDFMPWGALPVPDGDKVVEPLNRYIKLFESNTNPIYYTRDWHPPNHISFEGHGGRWPPHCVQDTQGAEFHKDLYMPLDNKFIISKGTSRDFDAYSGFQGTILHDLLQERGIKRVFVGGLATDYCVKNTVLGAINLGYGAFLLKDAIRGVNVKPDDSEKAIDLMYSKGAVGIVFDDIKK